VGAYRYGFNGKEKDPDMDGNNYDYGFRIYNPQIGKFLSTDPLTDKYPELTPYQFASNTPICVVDLDGLESEYYLNIPNSPSDVDTKHWTLNTLHKNPNGMQWKDPFGNKLSFDKAQFNADGTPKNGFLGIDHWHFEYANGNRYNAAGKVAKSYGATESNLIPGAVTKIPITAVVDETVITAETAEIAATVSKGSKNSGTLGLLGIGLTVVTSWLDLATGDPDAMINQFGSARVGELKTGRVSSTVNDKDYGNYYAITNETIQTWTENGVTFKKTTKEMTTYMDKAWDEKNKKYVGANPTGNVYSQSQTEKDGKVVNTTPLSGGEIL
jgi:RHS repeat-associated protein